MRRVACLAMLLTYVGCEETRLRTGAAELTTLEKDAVRLLVSPAGIGRLVEVANTEGLPLTAPELDLEEEGATVTIGPLEQTLPVSARTATPTADAVSLTTTVEGASVFVPIRIATPDETRICRWRFDAARIETTATLVLTDGEDGPTFAVEGTPTVQIESPELVSINDCSELADLLPDDLDQVLGGYVSAAFASSSAQSLPSSPVDTLGLLRGNTQLTHLSGFANRSGTLIIEAAVSQRPDALVISSDGLTIALDATAEAQRARCAPPTSIVSGVANGARPLDPDVVRRFGADFAIAVSQNWLQRVAQGATLAGYTCRGLEDARLPEVNDEVLPTEDILLEELGLENVPVGAFSTLVLAPGRLPDVQLQSDRGTIGVTWEDVQVEVYSEVLGTRTRLVRIVADAEFSLRPQAGSVGVARFEMESIGVETERIDSEFFVAPPADDEVNRWMRRTLLLMLEQRFEFPLPLTPAAAVRVVSVQVRTDDVVGFMRFD